MEIEGGEWIGVTIILLILMFSGGIFGYMVAEEHIIISQETGDKICFDLTGEDGVKALDYDMGNNADLMEKGELYCQLPSYDATQLIKVGK